MSHLIGKLSNEFPIVLTKVNNDNGLKIDKGLVKKNSNTLKDRFIINAGTKGICIENTEEYVNISFEEGSFIRFERKGSELFTIKTYHVFYKDALYSVDKGFNCNLYVIKEDIEKQKVVSKTAKGIKVSN